MKTLNVQDLGPAIARNFRQLNSEFEAADGVLQTQITALPKGRVGSGTATAAQTGITTGSDLTNLSVTFTATAGRRYRVSASVRLLQNTSAATATLRLLDAGGTQLDAWQATFAASDRHTGFILYESTPSAGSVTYKLNATTSAGTLDVAASATAPAKIIVEDIGLA